MADFCPLCRKDRGSVGIAHLCVARDWARATAALKPEPVEAKKAASNAPVPNRSMVKQARKAAPNGVARTARWRADHPEQHRAYMKAYMARRRASKRVGKAG